MCDSTPILRLPIDIQSRAGYTTTVGSTDYLPPDMDTIPSQPFSFLDSVNPDTSMSEDSDSESDGGSEDGLEGDLSNTLDGQSS